MPSHGDPGTTTQHITIAVTADRTFEPNETFSINLSNVTNALMVDAQGRATIINDDAAPTVSISDVTLTEGNAGTTNAVFMVTLTGATALPVTDNFATADSSAVAVADYRAQTGILTFAPGVTDQAITVAVVGDSAVESTELFSVALSGAVNATLANGSAVGRILDNDTRTLSINDVAVVEGDSGTTNAVFTVTLSAAALAPVRVGSAPGEEGAGAPSDDAAQTRILTNEHR